MEDEQPGGTRKILQGAQAAVVRVVPQPQCGVRPAAGADEPAAGTELHPDDGSLVLGLPQLHQLAGGQLPQPQQATPVSSDQVLLRQPEAGDCVLLHIDVLQLRRPLVLSRRWSRPEALQDLGGLHIHLVDDRSIQAVKVLAIRAPGNVAAGVEVRVARLRRIATKM
ncbi:hypothetical protein M5D96_010955 [Drosophila gunungcola]|uniref:Uncharacterized protein n=1 Tax=Drosophila gunungcola TaxID=103775 RepID=A0A9Q0BL02_9MUSC|nr:hypothetical protein M5D96_010955 [Drosophila gunungcola]